MTTGSLIDDTFATARPKGVHNLRRHDDTGTANSSGFENLVTTLAVAPQPQPKLANSEKHQGRTENADDKGPAKDQSQASVTELAAGNTTNPPSANPTLNTQVAPQATATTTSAAPNSSNAGTQGAPTSTSGDAVVDASTGTAVGPSPNSAVGENNLATSLAAGPAQANTSAPQQGVEAHLKASSALGQNGTQAKSAVPTQDGAPADPAATATATTAVPAPSTTNANGPLAPNKSKSAPLDAAAATQTLNPADTGANAATSETAGAGDIGQSTESQFANTNQPHQSQQLSAHALPMLAATLMRRFDSGARQFTMRLDPPELGQVEVKLSVAADKTVRAVISADRPEALADLTRSAKELSQALMDAGLDLEENGLTFSLNDQAGGQSSNGHGQGSEPHAPTFGGRPAALLADETSQQETAPTQSPEDNSADPFQRWQRARVALTA
ncbi:MAG: hypothetical protein RL186_133 [Pseudomonadota bacterium]